MPRYRFAGSFETVLLGLANGVNATVERTDGDGNPVDTGQAEGSTVVVEPGDVVTTDEPYENAQLVDLDPPAESPQTPAEAPEDVAATTTPEDSY